MEAIRHWLIVSFLLISILVLRLPGQLAEPVENVLEQLEAADVADAEWLEYLWELQENPLDLNRAGVPELIRIPFIGPGVAEEIVRFRKTIGGFETLKQLQRVEGVTPELFEVLRTLVTIQEKQPVLHWVWRSRAGYTFPEQIGFSDGTYRRPLKVDQRLLLHLGETISAGVLLEKDAGESSPADYWSGTLRYRSGSDRWEGLAGDYYLKMGFGLLLWTAYGDPLAPVGIPYWPTLQKTTIPNRSMNESSFLRGLTTSAYLKGLGRLQLFYSTRGLDASSSVNGDSVRSIYTTGLHRTASERQRKGILRQEIAGLAWVSGLGKFQLQATGIVAHYRPQIINRPESPYYLELAYARSAGKLQPAGELVLLRNRFPAIQQSVAILTRPVRFQLMMYYYHPDYWSPNGRAFGALNKIPQNQLGVAGILNLRAGSATTIGGYYHFFRPVRYSSGDFTNYRDYLVEAKHQLSKQLLSVQFRSKSRKNDLAESERREKVISGLRFGHQVVFKKGLELRTRLELKWAGPQPVLRSYQGISLYNQLNWSPFPSFRAILRWTSFDVPAYDFRVYEFEPELPGNFRVVMLNNQGFKWFVLLRARPLPALQIDLKFQQRVYPQMQQIGSGADQIDSDYVNDIRLSLIWRY